MNSLCLDNIEPDDTYRLTDFLFPATPSPAFQHAQGRSPLGLASDALPSLASETTRLADQPDAGAGTDSPAPDFLPYPDPRFDDDAEQLPDEPSENPEAAEIAADYWRDRI